MFSLNVTVNATPAQLLFAKLSGRLDDQSPVLGGKMYRLTLALLQAQFDTEGAATGKKWAPLLFSTIKKKTRAGFGHLPILQRTQQMLASFVKPRHAKHIRVISANSMIVGSRDKKAVYHQTGTIYMARRPIIPDQKPPAYIDALQQAMRDFIVEGRGA